jgi:hypothetical protein
MDARTQLEAERERLETALLSLEQGRLRLVMKGSGEVEAGVDVESLLASLGLVNAELAAIRHRDESRLRSDCLKPPGGF